jgi:hypothetical protein
MLNNPDQFTDFLANALPAQSTYFLQLLVVSLALTMGTEMLRVYPLSLTLARKFVGPNLTDEEREKRWSFFTPLEDPRELDHAFASGGVVFYFMVFFVYACLAPISSFFLLAMFILMESGFRYQFFHNYLCKVESGGQYWRGFLHLLQGCMIVAQLTLVGFLLLKKCFYTLPCMTPLLIFSCGFFYFLNTHQLPVVKFLPTGQCVQVDQRYRLHDSSFVQGMYMQPCIREAQSDDVFALI